MRIRKAEQDRIISCGKVGSLERRGVELVVGGEGMEW